ncbi:MAG: nuclear transport factor 2 family protein [Acidobacteria bacterium]|nr:nuclear transport factor 2 family protein [Acidobacteriota bacterium]
MPVLTLCLFLLAAAPDTEVRAVLDKQVAAWNRGDIEEFMTTYLDSPTLTFTGADGVTRGYRPVLERYRARYSSRAAMGTLQFSEIEVRLVGDSAALVLGRFDLARTAAGGGNAKGRFTLVLQLTPQGWKIIHDHSTASN